MIKYRPYRDHLDRAKVLHYCQSKNGSPPLDAEVIFVAVDENEEICGVVGLCKQWVIDPLFANDRMVANTLGRMIEGAAMAKGATSVFAEVDEQLEDWIKILIKTGFVVVGNNKTILEHYYG